MRQRVRKKLLSWLLLACMLATMIPTTAFAEELATQEETPATDLQIAETDGSISDDGPGTEGTEDQDTGEYSLSGSYPESKIPNGTTNWMYYSSVYIKNESYPTGCEFPVNITEFTSSDENVIVTQKNEDESWYWRAKNVGTTTITITYQIPALKNLQKTFSYECEVVDSSYTIDCDGIKEPLAYKQSATINATVWKESWDSQYEDIRKENITKKVNVSFKKVDENDKLVKLTPNGNQCEVFVESMVTENSAITILITATDENGNTLAENEVSVSINNTLIQGVPRYVLSEKSFTPKYMEYDSETPVEKNIDIYFKLPAYINVFNITLKDTSKPVDPNTYYPAGTEFVITRSCFSEEAADLNLSVYEEKENEKIEIYSQKFSLERSDDAIQVKRIDTGEELDVKGEQEAWEGETIKLQISLDPNFKGEGITGEDIIHDISLDNNGNYTDFSTYDYDRAKDTATITINTTEMLAKEQTYMTLNFSIKAKNNTDNAEYIPSVAQKSVSIWVRNNEDYYDPFLEPTEMVVGEAIYFDKQTIHFIENKENSIERDVVCTSLSSSNKKVASVRVTEKEDAYRIDAVGEGTATLTAKFSDGGERKCTIQVVAEKFTLRLKRTDGGSSSIIPGEEVTYIPEGRRMFTDNRGKYQSSSKGITYRWSLAYYDEEGALITVNEENQASAPATISPSEDGNSCTLKASETADMYKPDICILICKAFYADRANPVAEYSLTLDTPDHYYFIKQEKLQEIFDMELNETITTSIGAIYKSLNSEGDNITEENMPASYYWVYDSSKLEVKRVEIGEDGEEILSDLPITEDEAIYSEEPITFSIKRLTTDEAVLSVMVSSEECESDDYVYYIDEHKHTETNLNPEEPGCSKHGKKGGVGCSVCGAILKQPERIAPTGAHGWKKDEDGILRCKACGIEKPESENKKVTTSDGKTKDVKVETVIVNNGADADLSASIKTDIQTAEDAKIVASSTSINTEKVLANANNLTSADNLIKKLDFGNVNDNVTVTVTQSISMVVEILDYNNKEDEEKSIKLDITPVVATSVVAKDASGNKIDSQSEVKQVSELAKGTSVPVTVEIPEGFAEVGNTVSILLVHDGKTYPFKAKVQERENKLFAEFNNHVGFSTIQILNEKVIPRFTWNGSQCTVTIDGEIVPSEKVSVTEKITKLADYRTAGEKIYVATLSEDYEGIVTTRVDESDPVSLPVLTGSMTKNASSLVLKTKQKTTAFKVTGLVRNDYVMSWTSSNKKIFTVSGNTNGTCTIKAGKKTGTAWLRITLASGVSQSIKVKVQKKAVNVSSIKGLPKKVVIKKGQKYSLKPIINPITTKYKASYSSSNKKVAKVSKGVIQGKKAGKSTITVKAGKKKVKIKVIVK